MPTPESRNVELNIEIKQLLANNDFTKITQILQQYQFYHGHFVLEPDCLKELENKLIGNKDLFKRHWEIFNLIQYTNPILDGKLLTRADYYHIDHNQQWPNANNAYIYWCLSSFSGKIAGQIDGSINPQLLKTTIKQLEKQISSLLTTGQKIEKMSQLLSTIAEDKTINLNELVNYKVTVNYLSIKDFRICISTEDCSHLNLPKHNNYLSQALGTDCINFEINSNQLLSPELLMN